MKEHAEQQTPAATFVWPHSMTIERYCQLTGTSRSQAYRDMGAGELETVKLGRRRLILGDSARRRFERLRTAAQG